MDKRQKLEFLKFRGEKLSFAQKTLMPYYPLLMSSPPSPPCQRRPMRRMRALPSPAGGTPVGGAAAAGGRPRGRRRLRGQFCRRGSARRRCCLAGGRPWGVFASGSSGHRRRCPAVPPPSLLPRGASARGLSGRRRFYRAGSQPRRPQACCKQIAGRLLQAQRLRMRRRCAAWLRLRLAVGMQIEGSNCLLPFLAFGSTILTSKFFLNTIHAVQNQSFARTTWL